MVFKKLKAKLEGMELKEKIIFFISVVIFMVIGLLYLGLLIVPDWEWFIAYPILHQSVAYVTILAEIIGIFLIIYLLVDTSIDNQILLKTNQKLEEDNIEYDKKVKELETELTRLKGNR